MPASIPSRNSNCERPSSRLIYIRTHVGSFDDLRFRFQPVLKLTARREATSGRTIVSGLRNLPVNFLVRDRHFAFGHGGILFDEWLELRCSLSGRYLSSHWYLLSERPSCPSICCGGNH